MTNAEINQIFNSDETHKHIFENLGEEGRNIVTEIMKKLPADEFKEHNPLAKFDVADIPIPYSLLSRDSCRDVTLSEEIQGEMASLLMEINTPNTNLEYPYVMLGLDGDEVDYFVYKQMPVGETQACNYDWKWIEQFIQNPEHEGMKLAIFHTHPKSFGVPHKTLFNKYPDVLEQMGIQPDGLNISLADVYVMQYADMLVKKYDAKILTEALILMHNGELVSFSTAGGVKLTGIKTFECNKANQNE